ncbi:MAG: flagellar biosynthesis anti-sigma factor FlgM [Oscillospiraceae bacterium]|jgi:anti-sigma28 factor (negative regulator of flagellin synthesis)|nr:flagellar biosynthesis anti-sigma factor FlgM [Oscillospiraceae bacterium]
MRVGPALGLDVLKSYRVTKPPSANLKPVTARDEVTLSSEILTFSRVFAAAKNVAGTRSTEEKAHIEEITQAVRQGKYWVESDKIADKILNAVCGPHVASGQ